MMAATEHLVRDLLTLSTALRIGIRERVADHDLIALQHHGAVDRPSVVRRSLPAPAQRTDLQDLNPVAELDEPL
jgi:hypothetical protein